MTYNPPIDDMQFLLHDVLDFSHEDLDRETTEAVLGEAAKLASEVLAPLNHKGDQSWVLLNDDKVATVDGFKEAYQQFIEGGWNAVPFDPDFGGQGLPWALAFPIQEMWQGANMSFGLAPLLTQGAVEAISHHGTEEQKAYYLPKMVLGEWTGTMNLTEPQAGSDLSLLKSKAEPSGDVYKISGQKIFITYGEHDMAENIIHLVLARLPDAPEGTKGISLFIVPKKLDDGTRNAVKCIGLEKKLGIHASPTCVMEFKEATGYLLGNENEGLKCMFTMMNNARLAVGLQGVAIAEASYQHARAYAMERVQGGRTINGHSDVQRMLLSMKSQTEAGRLLAYDAAISLDAAATGDNRAKAKADLLTPIVKAWCTDMACDVASEGVQVFGGMGFIEETGAAQFLRDARILPIYEGTNGIQALDLIGRKVSKDGGASVRAYMEELRGGVAACHQSAFDSAMQKLEEATAHILAQKDDPRAVATDYLQGISIIAGGAMLSRASVAAEQKVDNKEFANDKRITAGFFMSHILPKAHAHLNTVLSGAQSVELTSDMGAPTPS